MHLTPGKARVVLAAALAAVAVAMVAIGRGLAARPSPVRSIQRGVEQFILPSGLTDEEAAEALAGRRELNAGEQPSPIRSWDRVRRESILTIFNLNLIGLSLVQMLLRDWWGAGVSLFMLSLTTGIRVLQESMAARRVRTYLAGRTPQYTVVREGRARSLDPELIVPGDVLVVGPGDQLLADGTLLGPASLLIDSSPVTGVRGWRRVRAGGKLHGGSFCVTGRGVYLAEKLGSDRLVSARPSNEPPPAMQATPLEALIARILQGLFALVVLYAALLLSAWFRLDLGAPGELFIDAAPVIFSLAPSGLYLMIIVTYATGTADLAQRGALVHSARSVEALAETTVLCFTEVGILAGTSMELSPVVQADGGQLPQSRLRQLLGDAARSTDATGPLLEELAESFEGERREVLDEAPFLATLGWAGMVFEDSDVEGLYVLGERRVVEGHLREPLPPDHEVDAETLVLAHRPDRAPLVDDAGHARLPDQLVALATVRFRRHLRPEAMEVVRGFVSAGVHIKAFASYSPAEAVAMLHAAGMPGDELDYIRSRGILSRDDLERFPRSEWGQVTRGHALYCGLTPVQVGEVVRALREQGERVAVVGDGVQDLPALKEATLGVAQPASTQAALGLADIVLLDNSPATLLKVLGRGQAIVRALIDVIKLNLTMVVCSALLIIDVRLISIGFPYVSAQGSVISILTVTIPSLVLSVSLSTRPRSVSQHTYRRTLTRFVLPAGISLSFAALAVYLYFVRVTGLVSTAQLAVTYTLLYAGLMVGFLARPTRQQALLALGLAAVGTLLPLFPSARRQFRLAWLPQPPDYAVVLVAVAVWLLVLLVVWRVLDRLRRPGRDVATLHGPTRHPLEPLLKDPDGTEPAPGDPADDREHRAVRTGGNGPAHGGR